MRLGKHTTKPGELRPQEAAGKASSESAGAPSQPPLGEVTSLRAKLTRLILIQLVVLGAAGAGAAAYRRVGDLQERLVRAEAQLRQTLVGKGQRLAANQRIAFRTLIADYALSDMRALVTGTVNADTDLAYGLVTNADEQVLAFASAPRLVPTLPSGPVLLPRDLQQVRNALQLSNTSFAAHETASIVRREFDAWGDTIVEHSSPVFGDDDQLLGVLRYGLSTRGMEASLAEIREQQTKEFWGGLSSIAAVSLVALLFGVWLSLRESRRIVEPLNALTTAAKQLARGKRHVRVSITSRDELQLLGEAFNRMVADLSESYERLERNHAQLLSEIAVREQAESERRDAEHQLAQSQKMEAIGQLAGGVAHDFNNLLTVIQGHSSLMSICLHDPQQAIPDGVQTDLQAHLIGIEEASGRAANLTRQLLAFSRHDQDDPRTLDLAVVVDGIEPMLRRLLREDIEIRVTKGSDPAHLMIDHGRLEQTIMNLAINAGDAMPEGGQLHIDSQLLHVDAPLALYQSQLPAGQYTRLAVSDTGQGIDPEHLAHLFEPFFTTKAVGKGTGLGLAMVHGIVRSAHGYLNVVSEVGRGTTFEIYCPAMPTGSALSVRPTPTAVPRGDGELVLLCEDDQEVRAITETFLRQYGYRVAAFAAPSDAIVYANAHASDIAVLVTDVVMPEKSGPELTAALSAIIPGLSVLYLSGYTAGALENYGLGEHSEQLLRKPFNSQDLCRMVHGAVHGTYAESP